MTARDQLKDGWTVVLRRQPARIVDGQAESPLPDHRRHSRLRRPPQAARPGQYPHIRPDDDRVQVGSGKPRFSVTSAIGPPQVHMPTATIISAHGGEPPRTGRAAGGPSPSHHQEQRTVIRVRAPGGSTGKSRPRWQDRSAAGSCVLSMHPAPHLLPAPSLTSGCPLSAATGRSNTRPAGRQRLRSRRHPLSWFEFLPAQTGKASAAPHRPYSRDA